MAASALAAASRTLVKLLAGTLPALAAVCLALQLRPPRWRAGAPLVVSAQVERAVGIRVGIHDAEGRGAQKVVWERLLAASFAARSRTVG